MMFIVILDVKSKTGLVSERVEAAIKTMGNWSNRLDSGWLLEVNGRGARGIRDHLKQFLGEEDRMFVARISRNWAGRNMGGGFPEWMQRREFGQFPNG